MNIKYRKKKKGKVTRDAGRERCVYQPDENISGLAITIFKAEEFAKWNAIKQIIKHTVLVWMEASRCDSNSINVTQIYVGTIYFILKQGYMFRLKVGHLQVLTTFPLPDALPTLGSHSVYSCGIHLSLNFLKRFCL